MDEQRTSAGSPSDRPAAVPESLAQVDATLEHLNHLCARLEQAEHRFKQMTEECGNVLEGLVAVDRRHAITLATLNDRLGDWCSIERKLLEESASRIERFERGVEREWMALRKLHEEPIEDLRDQADKLRAACLDAARLVRDRLDAADRSQLLQTVHLERRLAEWSERLIEAATAIQPTPRLESMNTPFQAEFGEHGAPSAVDPWPLEGVAQLHQEMRTAPPASRLPPVPATLSGTDPAPAPGDSPSAGVPAPAEAMNAEASHVVSMPPPAGKARGAWIEWAAVAVVIVVVGIVLGAYIVQMQRRLVDLEATTKEAARQVKQAAAKASYAESPAINAQESVERAGTIAEILAAPDLRRYTLVGVGPGQGAYGQVLWSRSRGMALSAVGLHAPASGVYRVWVIADNKTAAAGNVTIDGASAARLIVAGPLTLPRPAAIVVTLENNSSEARPTGPVCLSRTPAD